MVHCGFGLEGLQYEEVQNSKKAESPRASQVLSGFFGIGIVNLLNFHCSVCRLHTTFLTCCLLRQTAILTDPVASQLAATRLLAAIAAMNNRNVGFLAHVDL